MRVGRHDVAISNPDKVFFPERGLTKGDLVALLPRRRRRARCRTCARRPFHMKRFPNGVDGEFFHQKRVPAKHPDYVDEVPCRSRAATRPSSRSSTTPPRSPGSSNLGCIELHTWHSRVPEIELPDYLLIDLDPTRRRPVAVRARDRARRARGDGRARARVVPEDLGRDRAAHPGADPARAAASRRCGASRRRSPRRSSGASATRASRRRPGASPTASGVFVDFGQNARDRTIACAYSVRPTPDARVSAPLALGRGRRTSIRRPSRSRRCATRIAAVGDPMRGMWRRAVSLRPRFAKLGLELRRASRRPRRAPRAGGPQLAPGAVLRILVGPPAEELRAVAEAVALHLVVAHLDHELGPDARLLEPAAAPAVRLAGVPARVLLDERQHLRRDLGARLRRDRARADVVERRRPRGRGRAAASRSSSRVPFQRMPTTTQSAVLCSFTLTTPSREPGRYGTPSRFATTPSRPSDSKRSSQPRASSSARVDGESRKPFATRSSSARRSSSGRCHTGSPSQSSTSKTTYDAGISARQPPDPRLGRVEAHLHRVEVERALAHDHDLAVERGARREQLAERAQLREVAEERPPVPRPELRARPRGSRARRGSRPTSARTPSSSPSGSSRTSSASIGGNGSSGAGTAEAYG